MDVFSLREAVVADYARFTRSFTRVAAADIREFLEREYEQGRFWPAPLIQLNPNFVPARSIEELVGESLLDPECARVFRVGKQDGPGQDLRLHRHQEDAVRIAAAGRSYVLTTGTGSGKSLSYFVPIVDWALKQRRADPGRHGRITAIVVYPMNALCNSQMEELRKFLEAGYPEGGTPVTFARYTGQEKQVERDELARRPPDILLTNYMMLELILTRQNETDRAVVRASKGLRFFVLDELHTYRGRQGADVALLVRRVREALNEHLIAVGTSATMASGGDATDRRDVVSRVATRLFGTPVRPADVVTETLIRVTPEAPDTAPSVLGSAIDAGLPAGLSFESLRNHPVAAWIEMRLGLDREDGRWVRTRRPKSLRQAAELLAQDSGRDGRRCESYLKQFLLVAHRTHDAAGRSLFAFRLHQLIAGAGDLLGTLEPQGLRYLTLNGQQFQPEAERLKRLFPYCFCRECGQEYAPVWAVVSTRAIERIEPRELGDRTADDEDMRFGFFLPDPDQTFQPTPIEEAFPEEWIAFERGVARLKPHYRRLAPLPFKTDALGRQDDAGLAGWFIPGSFRFCLNPSCRVYYDASIRSDLTKLASLSTEGRSSATTILTLSAVRYLLSEPVELPTRAKKILGFTDNRQDASLQAGHFNDFVQILLLRGGLLAAIEAAPEGALTDEILTQRAFAHLRLDDAEFASNPQAKGVAAESARRALRDVLGYRLYFDLRRGWRITNPNIEQLGLLRIDYLSLDEACRDPELWLDGPDALVLASPEIRRSAAELLLDTMRRHLCIKTRYLDRLEQEQIRNRSHNFLKEPWGLSEDERMEEAGIFLPVAQPATWRPEYRVVFASLRSRLGRQLARPGLWGDPAAPAFPVSSPKSSTRRSRGICSPGSSGTASSSGSRYRVSAPDGAQARRRCVGLLAMARLEPPVVCERQITSSFKLCIAPSRRRCMLVTSSYIVLRRANTRLRSTPPLARSGKSVFARRSCPFFSARRPWSWEST
jgi:DEAD/DEAH box helicase